MSASTYAHRSDYDVIVVGASIAGCTASILLGREGARVALIERKPDPQAFKRMCSHYIQSSGIATLEKMGVLQMIEEAGGVRSRLRIWTLPASIARRSTDPRAGWLDLGAGSPLPPGVNIRRERLDPLLRSFAGEIPSVELMLGKRVTGLLRDVDRITGVELADGTKLRAKLVIAADGRDSGVGKMSGVRARRSPSARFTYAGYFEGPRPSAWPTSSLWFMDPQWAAALPTDSDLNVYLCMPTKDLLPTFRKNPEEALTNFMAKLPDGPPIRESQRVGPVVGKVDMPNSLRSPIGPGIAFAGDAALTTDPLWGVGCGWALQSADWLAESIAPALHGDEPLERGLRRYRRRFLTRLPPHAAIINDYSTGRPLTFFERLLFTSAALDSHVTRSMELFSTRTTGPHVLASPGTTVRIATAGLRRWLSDSLRPDGGTTQWEDGRLADEHPWNASRQRSPSPRFATVSAPDGNSNGNGRDGRLAAVPAGAEAR